MHKLQGSLHPGLSETERNVQSDVQHVQNQEIMSLQAAQTSPEGLVSSIVSCLASENPDQLISTTAYDTSCSISIPSPLPTSIPIPTSCPVTIYVPFLESELLIEEDQTAVQQVSFLTHLVKSTYFYSPLSVPFALCLSRNFLLLLFYFFFMNLNIF